MSSLTGADQIFLPSARASRNSDPPDETTTRSPAITGDAGRLPVSKDQSFTPVSRRRPYTFPSSAPNTTIVSLTAGVMKASPWPSAFVQRILAALTSTAQSFPLRVPAKAVLPDIATPPATWLSPPSDTSVIFSVLATEYTWSAEAQLPMTIFPPPTPADPSQRSTPAVFHAPLPVSRSTPWIEPSLGEIAMTAGRPSGSSMRLGDPWIAPPRS